MSSLRIQPLAQSGEYHHITPATAQWNHLHFGARILYKGEKWSFFTGEFEYGIILLGGNYRAETDKGVWETTNGRRDVFSGMAHTLYLPRRTEVTITATSEVLDLGYGWVATNQDFDPVFKTPEEVEIEIRGGDNATRQINSLLQPGFPCHRLVAVEVYTPSGNWSSFPAHKHDIRKVNEDGVLLEANLEETYFYKMEKPQGFAIQRVYTDDRSLDELAVLHHNEVMLIPKGYHPVAAGHGYHVYYLNFLAGSDQSLANTPDPDHSWIFSSWKGLDPRIPLVTANMNLA